MFFVPLHPVVNGEVMQSISSRLGEPPACRYYGRNVGIKIMPTGVNCERLLAGLQWKDTIWRQGELKVGPADVALLQATLAMPVCKVCRSTCLPASRLSHWVQYSDTMLMALCSADR